jgi:hypothetical protein
MNLISLKERIAVCSLFRPDERDFILNAINDTAEWQLQNGDVLVHDPGNYLGRIDHIYAYLSIDDGGEGICGINNMPLAIADRRIVDKVKDQVRMLAKATNKVIRLAKFSTRTDIEIIRP